MNIATNIERIASSYGSKVTAENGESALGIFPYGDYLAGPAWMGKAGNSADRIICICGPNSLKSVQKGDIVTINDVCFCVSILERIYIHGEEVYLTLALRRTLELKFLYDGAPLPIRLSNLSIKRGTKIERISTISSGIFNEGAGSEPIELLISGYVNKSNVSALSSTLDSLSDNSPHILQVDDIEINAIIGTYRLENSHDDALCEITFTQSRSIGG